MKSQNKMFLRKVLNQQQTILSSRISDYACKSTSCFLSKSPMQTAD